jgi:hypothetical protein
VCVLHVSNNVVCGCYVCVTMCAYVTVLCECVSVRVRKCVCVATLFVRTVAAESVVCNDAVCENV